jgi:putative GTP pyrophosphokinase
MPDSDTDEYEAATANLAEFGGKIVDLINAILKSERISVSEVSSRVKSRKSATDKLQDGLHKYDSVADLTDLLGVRVVTFFADDVDKVCEIIEREFKIDPANSIDKRSTLDPDRFGYLSVHYVLTLNDKRAELAEYRAFASIRAEVQVRSILQHAWAEIEHDLGYKTKEAVPRDVRRRFSRLAGMLEVADTEFLAIRHERSERFVRVSAQIKIGAGRVLLDQISLTAFIQESDLVSETDDKIALILRTHVVPDPDVSIHYADRIIHAFTELNITSINEMSAELNNYSQDIIEFAKHWAEWRENKAAPRPPEVSHGVSLMYLALVVAAERFGPSGDFPQWASRVLDGGSEIAESVLDAYNKSQE